MESNAKKTLLQRYGIPINHLDFSYIKECKNAKEMEKIVHILTSNEEGHFPDLTKCAEEKLRELKPHSRLFRIEENIKGREALSPNEIKPIYEWNKDIKTTDKKLHNIAKDCKPQDLPPIRRAGRILSTQNNTSADKPKDVKNVNKETKSSQRIKSTDYSKWDKYDPDEEILRAELAEEREQEEVERRNRINAENLYKEPLKITEITEEDEELVSNNKWSSLSDIEKEKLSDEYRLRGNEYFRAKEYDNALNEYSRAIQACPDKAVAAYNNRAVTYIKQQKFSEAIEDCEKCLKLEPQNLKARLRLAEATYAYGRRRESYQLYIDVLQVDSENSVALTATRELRKEFEDLPPPNATRLKIQDESSKNNKEETTKKALSEAKPTPKQKPKSINYDLADLVKPNKLIRNQFIKAAENLGKNMENNKTHKTKEEKKVNPNTNQQELRIPGNFPNNALAKGKKLIQEL